MLFRDLRKFVDNQVQQQVQSEALSIFRGKGFWIWDRNEHREEHAKTNGNCCMQHIIGLPQKNGIDLPLFDYERIIYDTLQNHKHVWIKKATGLGASEFMFRFMAWLCLKDNALSGSGSQMCIVTGPRIELAIALIGRMKLLFSDRHMMATFDTKETVIELNDVKIEAFPSHHLDAMRGLSTVGGQKKRYEILREAMEV